MNEGGIVKKKEGAIGFKTEGKNMILLNWKEGIIEIWCNGERKFIIDMNGD